MTTVHQGSFDQMEGYITRGCYLGNNIYFAVVSTSLALRTRLLFKGEGMLGSYPNPLLINVPGLQCPAVS